MKKKFLTKFVILFFILLNITKIAFSEEDKKDFFENKTHLGINISNFSIKGNISRDINKDFELGFNAYYGGAIAFQFKDFYNLNMNSRPIRTSKNLDHGHSFEIDLKQNLIRFPYRKIYDNVSYIKYFIGTSFLNKDSRYDYTVDGYVGHYFLGLGLGDEFYLEMVGFNFSTDIGLAFDTSYNSIAFTLFPRAILGVSIRF
ncbi:MAG: hypothetical protein U0457_00930 [Candidatus Sericytochromatia bacterium]